MYVRGVSTRKVKATTEELCGHAFSASAHLRHQQTPGREPRSLRRAPLAEPFAYLIFDAHYEKVREAGVVMSQAVLVAVGIDWDGRARSPNTIARPRIWFSKVTRCSTSFLWEMINERSA